MTYTIKDTSVHDGQPIEVYKFIGTLATYRYTDNAFDVVVAGETYTPLPITRNAFEVSTLIDSIVTMDFVLPFDAQLAIDYGRLTTPENLTVEVRRVHRGDNFLTDSHLVWTGISIGYNLAGRWFTVGTQNKIQTDLNAGLNSIYYQTTCNHILYDERCKMSRSSFDSSSTITVIGAQSITVANDGVVDHFLRAGEIINARTGERRLIVDNLVNVISLGYGFLDVQLGDSVTMVAGCDHSYATCKSKFNNVDNFGGFMFIPVKNPFDNGV